MAHTVELVGKLECPQIAAGIRRIADLPVPTDGQEYANADLIAAAPDLLAALEGRFAHATK